MFYPPDTYKGHIKSIRVGYFSNERGFSVKFVVNWIPERVNRISNKKKTSFVIENE